MKLIRIKRSDQSSENPKLVLHQNSMINKHNYDGICKFCFEVAIFRHILYDGKNAIICTRCKQSVAFIKGHVIRDIILSHYTRYVLLIRNWRRLKNYLTGGLRPYPFGMKRSILKQLTFRE